MVRKRTGGNVAEGAKSKKPTVHSQKAKPTNGSRNIILAVIFLIVFVLYVIIPLAVYYSPAVRRHAVFLNYISLSREGNLSVPTESGLKCSRNLYIGSEDGLRLGAWHIPPLSKCKEDGSPSASDFNDGRPVFLYLHGNAGTRGGGHRVKLYKLLAEQVDAHVLAFDYRGFGDSSNVNPTENGLVQDTNRVYDWLRKQHVDPSRILVWGHSLGTGVGVAFLNSLAESPSKPGALILEAPFTKIIEAAKYHPISIFHRYMPFFETLIANPIGDEETGFDSIGRIHQVSCPLLILHAEDDGFVPFEHGKILYEEALRHPKRKSLRPEDTQFVGFDGKFDLGHKNIYKSPDLPSIITKFIKNIGSKSKLV
ncbi:hypothetical protein JTE90_009420 [Oedothorax gibbosus]|uniref:AB hydrolase-1 domain-containing protein n=1 Tax=Oedothorax gibbosus TaxID=931172 RepID=A0AAV6VU61_9ARAC|nr:hypothetical protein JTE90_009420 [Oedothorax gibbosus]